MGTPPPLVMGLGLFLCADCGGQPVLHFEQHLSLFQAVQITGADVGMDRGATFDGNAPPGARPALAAPSLELSQSFGLASLLPFLIKNCGFFRVSVQPISCRGPVNQLHLTMASRGWG